MVTYECSPPLGIGTTLVEVLGQPGFDAACSRSFEHDSRDPVWCTSFSDSNRSVISSSVHTVILEGIEDHLGHIAAINGRLVVGLKY